MSLLRTGVVAAGNANVCFSMSLDLGVYCLPVSCTRVCKRLCMRKQHTREICIRVCRLAGPACGPNHVNSNDTSPTGRIAHRTLIYRCACIGAADTMTLLQPIKHSSNAHSHTHTHVHARVRAHTMHNTTHKPKQTHERARTHTN